MLGLLLIYDGQNSGAKTAPPTPTQWRETRAVILAQAFEQIRERVGDITECCGSAE